ncbi:MAG: AzlC family ABC transporter permease [bacterium]|nr:AzlC family ABC transporter permease [bacterium]
MKNQIFSQGLRDGLPICLGYFSVSFAFGMNCVVSGFPLWAATLASLTNVTSAGQFAGVNLILADGSYLELAITTLIINIRYFLMSLSLSQKTDASMPLWQRLLVSFGITDEIFAVSMQHTGNLTAPYMAGLIATPLLGWVLGTFCGGAITSRMPQSLSSALGIALYGMFIAIVVPPAKKEKSILFTALLALILSCLFSWLPALKQLSGGWSIIVITLFVSALAALLFPLPTEHATEDTESNISQNVLKGESNL